MVGLKDVDDMFAHCGNLRLVGDQVSTSQGTPIGWTSSWEPPAFLLFSSIEINVGREQCLNTKAFLFHVLVLIALGHETDLPNFPSHLGEILIHIPFEHSLDRTVHRQIGKDMLCQRMVILFALE